MSRVIAILACGFTLTACTSSWMPSFDMPNFGGGAAPEAVSLAVESDPPGAEARSSTGPATCRTPCQLSVSPTGPFTVSIALNGYQSQTVSVQTAKPDDPRISSEGGGSSGIRLDPNPIFVELVRAPAPPPPVAKKKPVRRTPTAAHRAPTDAAAPATAAAPPQFEPAPATAAAAAPPAPPPPATSSSAAPPSSATAAAPWPMPR